MTKKRLIMAGVALLLITPFFAIDCGGGGGKVGNMVLAEINGEKITENDVRSAMGSRIQKVEMDLYDMREAGVNKIVEDKLIEAEAKKRGVNAQALMKTEVLDKVDVTGEEVKTNYAENKERYGTQKYEELEGRIKGYLLYNKRNDRKSEFISELKKSAKVEMYIKAPTMEINVGDSPALGSEGAKVTLVEFSDFQCPFCGRARPTINQLIDDYKDKLRYVFKDFPLSFHQDAFKAHEAAHCAGEEGKYWDYNKKVWENQRALKVADLKKYAGEIELDMKKFNTCLEGGKFAEKVRKGLEEGQEVGVSGTPAFFINGRMLSGARPYEAFKEIIDRELAK